MKEMKVEWVSNQEFFETKTAWVNRPAGIKMVPVVQLAQVDALIKEAVWAMELLQITGNKRAKAFLASPVVGAWRERQKKETA